MKLAIAGILWVVGLLIASSDNDYMPWVNGIGLIVFLIASIIINKESSTKRRSYLHYD